LYVNGSSIGTTTNSGTLSFASPDSINVIGGGASGGLNSYFQDFRIYKGLAKYTSSFTPPTTYTSAIAAGNDSLRDSPTNGDTADDTGAGGEVPGNYATLNPLQKSSGSTLSNGNLDISMSSAQGTTFATMAFPASGKWYFECTANATQCDIGIAKADASLSQYLGNNSSGYGYYVDGNVYHNNSSAGSGATYTTGDVIGVAFDADAGTCKWYKNNSLQVTISSLSGEWFPAFGSGSAAGIFNFGSRPFAYSAPSNHKALCTANLDDPTIADGSTAMDVALYTGNGTSQTISGLGFSPDFVWLKSRSNLVGNNLYDVIRGVNKPLITNSTAAEDSTNIYGAVSAFNSDGFDVQVGSTDAIRANASSYTYVAWTWDAGSSTVSNTDGSITSSVRANPTAGFSVVTYTSDSSAIKTVGHGLNVAPAMIIWKDRDAATNWFVFHNGGTPYMFEGLNTTAAGSTSYANMNSTLPTSSVFTLNSGGYTINPTGNHAMVAYCFAPVEGYSAFGSYTGNGASGWPNADGPFIHLGFRPRFILWKCTSQAENWHILDSNRGPYNFVNNKLLPNSSAAETVNNNHEVDFLSNGFKLRNNTGELNQSGQTYVYCAFAENPFKYARAR